jgi:AcrR family transcriptional regulator
VSSAEQLNDPNGAAPPARSLKQDIVRVAIELGTELGEDGLTMRGIASRLGVSATALYQHFDGKSSILRAIRFHGLEAMNDCLQAAFRNEDPMEAIRDCVARYVEFGRANPWLYGVLFVKGEVDYESLGDEERATVSFPQDKLSECFAKAKTAGKIKADVDEKSAPFVLWSAAHGLTCLSISGRISDKHPSFPAVDEGAFVNRFVDLAVSGFVA